MVDRSTSLDVFGHVVQIDIQRLQTEMTPVQAYIGSIPAAEIGLGSSLPDNLALRKRVNRPGAPFGGLGKFDPQVTVPSAVSGEAPLEINADVVCETKVGQFKTCSEGGSSIYFWVMQPIFNSLDLVVGAEILVRAKNGTDSAPFEDLLFFMDPQATPDVCQAYASWKAEEMVGWTLKALKEYPVLQSLHFISSNVRPLDLSTSSLVFQEVERRLHSLTPEDRELVCRLVCIEVTEDQVHPEDITESLQAWRNLGFVRLTYDDTIGDLAHKALGKKTSNLHTTTALEPLVHEFWLLKVDIDWAGHMIFLGHPACKPNQKAEVLQHAQEEDQVYVARGPALVDSGMKHSEACSEFATWSRQMIDKGKCICIELTVRQDDVNNAFAIERLKGLGLDIFGADSKYFSFQGGLLGPKALEPSQLAQGAKVLEVT
jgi:hypothetical protein